MQHIYDVIIIGGGPAGCTAALYSARAGLDTLVAERMSAGGQMALTDIIDNYPGFEEGVDGFTLGMKMQQCAERFGAKTEYTEVLSVDFSKPVKEIHTSLGTLFGKTVIISTGANPRELGLSSEKELAGRGVHYCAHCDGRFYKDKTVAVIGGGNTAAEDALYLSRIAKKVYLIHRREKLRATEIYRAQLARTDNVELLLNSAVSAFIADGKLTGVNIKNVYTEKETELSAEGVFVSIGRKPATEFLQGALELDENGYIIADETTKTSAEGVFAAGDVRTKALRQVITAAADGAAAAFSAELYLSGR